MYVNGEDCVRILFQGKGDSELNLSVFCSFVSLYAYKWSLFTHHRACMQDFCGI